MMVAEAPIRPSILDESTMDEALVVEESRWNDAGLTPEDLAAWLPPGLPVELECDTFMAFEFAPPAD